MKIRTASLLAAVTLGGLAVAAYAQGVFDPGPVPPLPEASEDEAYPEAEPVLEEQGETGEIVYESYEVVQPIDDTPGPAARTIEPPEGVTEEWVEVEPSAAPVRRGKLVKIARIARTPDKRVRIGS